MESLNHGETNLLKERGEIINELVVKDSLTTGSNDKMP